MQGYTEMEPVQKHVAGWEREAAKGDAENPSLWKALIRLETFII